MSGTSPVGTMPYRIDPSRDQLNFDTSSKNPLAKVKEVFLMGVRLVTNVIDQSHPYPSYRWLVNAFLLVTLMARVILLQGFYVVAYTLGIYLLSSFLLFLTPKFDPALEMDNDADLGDTDDADVGGPALPTSSKDEEFRPFIRRLPEFVFW